MPTARDGVAVREVTLPVAGGSRAARCLLPAGREPSRALLWLHGGAFVSGSFTGPEADGVARALARRGVAVLTVDYRLAALPGIRRTWRGGRGATFPEPVTDCLAAWSYLLDAGLVPGGAVSVGGAGAGAALATMTMVRASAAGLSGPRTLLLAYPVLHGVLPPPGAPGNAGGRWTGAVARAGVPWAARRLIGSADPARITAAFPGPDDLPGRPPTVVVTAERDGTRGAAESFAAGLAGLGAEVSLRMEPGTWHGFLNWPGSSAPGARRTPSCPGWRITHEENGRSVTMPTTDVDGLEIAYEIIGDGGQTWALTPGGRFSKDYGGVRELAEGLAGTGRRVLIWDRPNCGASTVSFRGSSESALQADTLAGLIRGLDLGPVVVAGGSGGSRVSLLTVARNPDIASGLAMWWISGGVFGLMALGWYYCGGSIDAAWKYGMEKVVELPEWQEVISRNPRNRERFLAMDREAFIADLERWMAAYAPPTTGQTIPGISDRRIASIAVPTMVFRSGTSDPAHPRATSEAVAAAIPGARLVEPPWGDREWAERGEARDAGDEALFTRWPLLVPQLAAFGDGLS